MKDKFVEGLRRFLKKTWVPLREKRDALIGRLRLSMSYRISLNYLKLMIVNGIIFMAVFLVLYLNTQTEEYRKLAEQIVAGIEARTAAQADGSVPEGSGAGGSTGQGAALSGTGTAGAGGSTGQDTALSGAGTAGADGSTGQGAALSGTGTAGSGGSTGQDMAPAGTAVEPVWTASLNPYADYGVHVTIRQKDSQNIVYDDTDFTVKGFLFFRNLHIEPSNEQHKIVINETMPLTVAGVKYEATFSYNLTRDYNRMWKLVLNMIFLYAIIVYFILREARGQNVRMLTPIQEMSDTVNRITVNNLHSERLNVKGMKDELKDLAETFNQSLDRLELSYESQKQFVSDASHELRTPIAVVQGYANMLKRWGSRDEAVLAESVEAISNEAAQMQDLVEKLLFLSRHDKKTLKLNKTYFNIKPVVEEMVKETKLVAHNRSIESPALEPVQVYGDKQAIKQAIRVFIDNAQKYTEDGDSIRISCENRQGDCVITVEDTGVGMRKKDLDNIFNRFYRADDVRDRKIEGHGLGLSIAKLIILAHTGRIKIRTQYTKGTSFIVTIPKVRQGAVR